jgi:hypothetical protein
LKTTDGSYNTFDLRRFGYLVADEYGVVHRRSGTVPPASAKIGSSSAAASDPKGKRRRDNVVASIFSTRKPG